jgi:hypothetical protein
MSYFLLYFRLLEFDYFCLTFRVIESSDLIKLFRLSGNKENPLKRMAGRL